MDNDEIRTRPYETTSREWLKVLAVYNTPGIEKLASKYRDGMSCDCCKMQCGSFNFCFKVIFEDRVTWAVRFPIPGKVMHPEEKIRREVAVMRFLRQKTSIPVPEIMAFGMAADNHDPAMGPFIITRWVEGVKLSETMETLPMPSWGHILNEDIDDDMLYGIYRQMAKIMLELAKHDFDSIGALEEVNDGKGHPKWQVSARPMTLKMNEIQRGGYISMNDHDLAPFKTVSQYMRYLLNQNIKHLDEQRNSVDDADDARKKYIRRQQTMDVLDYLVVKDHDSAPFKLFCDDLRPGNILVDPTSLKIVAVFDWEWTYAAPYQFSYSPPPWLILSTPGQVAEQEYDDLYDSKFELFVKALEAEEDEADKTAAPKGSASSLRDSTSSSLDDSASSSSSLSAPTAQEERMSVLMRRAKRDGILWSTTIVHESFSFDMDSIWQRLEACLQSTGRSIEADARPLDERVVDAFVTRKMKELAEYKSELASMGSLTLDDGAGTSAAARSGTTTPTE